MVSLMMTTNNRFDLLGGGKRRNDAKGDQVHGGNVYVLLLRPTGG